MVRVLQAFCLLQPRLELADGGWCEQQAFCLLQLRLEFADGRRLACSRQFACYSLDWSSRMVDGGM
ncbi:hypothetical protein MU1_44930 [Paenibacillus glycanilyticus]|uniref:Secreted protein n=1 Tax=Paenibacillus glycanilyticus TaxID=126569 RepID=A0ABQ6GM96_9BACL|nr:hypothetical protein MU1_44930 [Paenibacillus glycanilyticus]